LGRRRGPSTAPTGPDGGAVAGRPLLLDLDAHFGFDELYAAGPSDAYRARLAAMPPYVLEVFLRSTVDRQSVLTIAQQLGLSRRTVRRLLREAIAIISIEPD
jgi:DNA-directed RNA polymerase specialized sigma24 family protein